MARDIRQANSALWNWEVGIKAEITGENHEYSARTQKLTSLKPQFPGMKKAGSFLILPMILVNWIYFSIS